MKNLVNLLLTLIVIALYSCDSDENMDQTVLDTEKTIIIGGNVYYTGYGYNILNNRIYRPAIINVKDQQNTDFVEDLDVDIQVIKTNKDIEDFVSEEKDSVTTDNIFKINRTKNQIREYMENQIKVNKNTISLIGRISVKKNEYNLIANGEPAFNSRAQRYLDSGQIERFLGKYGTMYVKSTIVGGDVYFLYSYDISTMNEQKRTIFEENIEINAKNIFAGQDNNTVLSSDEQEEIRNSQSSSSVTSNIVGYIPTLVSDKEQFEQEVQNVMNYLIERPANNTTIEQTLASFSDIVGLPEFTEAFEKEAKCYTDMEKWNLIRTRVLDVYDNTTDMTVKVTAENALIEIDQQIVNSTHCVDSATPTGDEYADIIL